MPAERTQIMAEGRPRPRPRSPWEARAVLGLILTTLLLSSLPYALGYFIAPSLRPPAQFVGTAYNIDDYCNYLSWLRQTMEGHFFLLSLFTTEAQQGLEFNIFFWLLGRLADAAHWSPQAAMQCTRVLGAVALLLLIYRFYRRCLPQDVPARLTAFGFTCLGSGFGWATWAHWRDKSLSGSPVDAWQPEAYTFLTIYTSSLMTVSTVLIVAALYALLRGEQTGKWRYAVIAGVCGAILGNMHSYDVLHLSAAWGLYLVVWTVLKRGRGVEGAWGRGLLALGLTLPTTIYQYIVFNRETVFRARANVPTLSPAIVQYALGYGLVFLLACVAFVWILRALRAAGWRAHEERKERGRGDLAPTGNAPWGDRALLFAACWAVAGLLVIYLPFAFQRKMLMGEHVPLCLLAGVGASYLTRRLSAPMRTAALALLVLASAPSNLLFLSRDINHLEHNRSETIQFPFLGEPLVDMYAHIHTLPPGAAVLGPPALCAYIPGYSGRAVWVGHWAETPDYPGKVKQFLAFQDSQTPDDERQRFLQSTGAGYLLYPNDVSVTYTTKDGVTHQFVDLAHAPPSYLRVVYTNADYTLFQIHWPPT